MRRAILALLLIAASLPVQLARAQINPAPPPAPENLAAARELIVVMRATDQFKAVLPTILQNMKAAVVQNRPEMEKNYDAMAPLLAQAANARVSELTEQMAQIYARHFSVDEMKQLAAFYQSPIGQKLLAEQPAIARETMAAGQQFGRALALDIQTRALDALRKQSGGN